MSHFKKYQLPILLLRYNSQLAFNLVKKFKNVITQDFVKRRVSKVSNMVINASTYNTSALLLRSLVPYCLMYNTHNRSQKIVVRYHPRKTRFKLLRNDKKLGRFTSQHNIFSSAKRPMLELNILQACTSCNLWLPFSHSYSCSNPFSLSFVLSVCLFWPLKLFFF